VTQQEEPDWTAEFDQVGTSTIASLLASRGYRHQFVGGLSNYGARGSLAAPAYTLRLIPTRPDLAARAAGDPYREAIEKMPPGQALLVDSMGDPRGGVIGDMLATRLAARGVSGVVTDGAVRDSRGLAPLDLSVYARAVNSDLRSSYSLVAGVQEPVACGGVSVIPGDILVGDEDGVIVVPRALAEEVARLGREQEDLESYVAIRLRAGEPLEGLYPPNETHRAAHFNVRARKKRGGEG
jgi:regulator of RNase E activity RraA